MIYLISDIEALDVTQKFFQTNSGVEGILKSIQTHWYEDGESINVIIEVSKEISHFFRRKKQLPSQEIVEETSSGGLKVSFEVSHEEELDNLVKSWLPHIHILEPKHLQMKLVSELQRYIDNYT